MNAGAGAGATIGSDDCSGGNARCVGDEDGELAGGVADLSASL